MILRNVEVNGRIADLRLLDGVIAEIGAGLSGDDEVVDGAGGAVLPSLHDHHIHLMALAAARSSVDCSGGLEALAQVEPGRGWIRAVGFPGSVDRHVLDSYVPDRPVRVQHRGGSMWMVNTVALEKLQVDSDAGVERDGRGEPTGRLFRYDSRLRAALADTETNLSEIVTELRALGITSVTDATPDLDDVAVKRLAALPLDVTLLGDPRGSAPWKIVLHDHNLQSWEWIVEQIGDKHEAGRPVAVHCVSRESILLATAALDHVGRIDGDRIEHAGIVPDPRMLHGLLVVTQPGFIADRGDDFVRNTDPRDREFLYPYASLLADGVDTVASSDAPYGPLDPWAVMRAARDRIGPDGSVVGYSERVSVKTALGGYLRDSNGRPRRVQVGAPAQLVLMRTPLREVLDAPSADLVRRTIVR